jgi:ubiquitin C-terminal hydrolase
MKINNSNNINNNLEFKENKESKDLRELKHITNTKEIIMMHIFNNYKKIFSKNVYEEFFNLFGSILSYDKDLVYSFLEETKLKEISIHIIDTIRNLSKFNDMELTETQHEQLSGNIYLFQCLCLNYENIICPILDKIEDFNIIDFFYGNLFVIENVKGKNNNNQNQNNIGNKISNYVRFKYSQRSLRQKTYELLITFIKFKDSYKKTLGEKLILHHKSFTNEYLDTNDINIDLRSAKDKFIGLQNYGCTCYLNALMQQLYMISQFRENLFELDVEDYEERKIQSFSNTLMRDKDYCKDNDIEDYLNNNPVYQLQKLFANLSYSIKQYHSPMHFISSFKAFNNEPINVRIQQDCEEFLNILVDKLENYTKLYSLNKKDIFDDSFRGKISYEIISLEQEYSYYSETENQFLAISLEIKNKRTIEEALDLYIRGEILEGENKYLVEKYDKKISILRRCSIKKLSNTVIIHLKRFEFDYNTFDKIKIIDYCQFPDVIDFKPWMRSSIISKNKEDPNYKDIHIDENELNDQQSFKYKLTGILVHSGSTADGGHYYSIIFDKNSNKWFKFDDSRITEFPIENLRAECFGEDKENNDMFLSRSQTAYLLFYTKISDEESKNKYNNNNDNNLNNNDNNSNNLNLNFNSDEEEEEEKKVPKKILEKIRQENSSFLKYKTYLDNDYYKFIKDYIDFTVMKNKNIEKLIQKEQSMSLNDLINEDIYNEISNKINKFENFKNINLDFDMRNYINLEEKNLIENVFMEKEKIFKIEIEKNKINTNATFYLKKKVLKFGIYFYFEIILQQKDPYRINSYSNFIREIVETDKRIACWFLKKMIKNKSFFNKMILENSSSEIRESMKRIILNCILSLYNEESKYLKEEFNKIQIKEIDFNINKSLEKTSENTYEIIISKEYKSCVMRFFKNNIINEFDNIRIHWSRFNQFLYIINECFNSLLFELFEISVQSNLYQRIIYMIMNNSDNNFKTNFITMGAKNIDVNINLLLDILSCIVQGKIK